MSNYAATARTYRAERTPSPIAGIIFCLLILTGGATAGHDWATAQCASGVDLGVVCKVTA